MTRKRSANRKMLSTVNYNGRKDWKRRKSSMRHTERGFCVIVSHFVVQALIFFLTSKPSCLGLQIAGITSLFHHTWLKPSNQSVSTTFPFFFLLFFLFHLCISVYVYVHRYTAHVWWSDSDYRSQFCPSATCVPGAQIWVVRLNIKHLWLLSHLVHSQLFLYYTNLSINE